MKKYIIKFMLISFLFIGCVASLFFVSFLSMKKASFSIEKKGNILVLGNSMTECSINDQVFSRSVNLSYSADAAIYSFIKLKKLIPHNSDIDTIVLSYSGAYDRNWTEGISLTNKMKTYSFIIDNFDDLKPISKETSFYIGMARAPLYQAKNIFRSLTNRQVSYKDMTFGGYLPLDRKIDNSQVTTLTKSLWGEVDTLSLEYQYIRKIIDYCEKRNIKVILLFPPIYQGDKIADREKMNESAQLYFPEATFLDFSDFPIGTHFADGTHLNRYGAQIFSEYLRCYGFTRDSIEVYTKRRKEGLKPPQATK